MLRRICLRSVGFALSSLSFVVLCAIGLSPTWAQGGGSQQAKVTTSGTSSPQIAVPQPAAPTAPTALTRPAVSDDDKSYRIGPGDLLNIQVFNRPELTREVRVNNQGRIPLALIDEVPAACLTESQLVRAIAEKYTKYIRNPQVNVFIKEYNSQPVAVIGAVNKPAQFKLERRVRLIELLTYVGGANEKAGRKLLLIRTGGQAVCEGGELKTAPNTEAATPVLTELNLRDIMTGSPEANLYIQSGDIITVPEADQIFVSGNVIKPGPFPLQNRTTLTEAINMASGLAPDAAKKRISVSRQDPVTGMRKETIYNYEDIKARRAEDVVLQANDIIEVPNSTGSSVKRGLINAFTQSAGLIPVYTIIR